MPRPPEFVKGTAEAASPLSEMSDPSIDVESRCVMSATAFSEYSIVRDASTRKLPLYWFALTPGKPLFFVAGIWGTWKGVRKVKEGELDHELFGFRACGPNGVVVAINQKAMSVI